MYELGMSLGQDTNQIMHKNIFKSMSTEAYRSNESMTMWFKTVCFNLPQFHLRKKGITLSYCLVSQ